MSLTWNVALLTVLSLWLAGAGLAQAEHRTAVERDPLQLYYIFAYRVKKIGSLMDCSFWNCRRDSDLVLAPRCIYLGGLWI